MDQINLIFGIVAAFIYWHASARTDLMQRREIIDNLLGVAQWGFLKGLAISALFAFFFEIDWMMPIRLAAYGMVLEVSRWYVPRFMFGNR